MLIKLKSNFKILIINCSLLLFFLILGEISIRIFKFIYKCKIYTCDYSLFTFKPYQKSFHTGITKIDSYLGYDLNKNFKNTINDNVWGWKDVKVSTDKNGLRNQTYNQSKHKVLTVGDSFAFGDKVSDSETWQSCLNKNIPSKNFLNGGVFGYGTGQAIMKAEKIYPRIKPNNLMVQTLVGYNFKRDQMSIKNGFVKPYFSKKSNSEILIIPVKTFNVSNTKYSKRKSLTFKDHIIVNFTFLNIFHNNYLTNQYKKSKLKFTKSISNMGDNHASIKDIIEWSAKKSKSLDPNVTWLLQYNETVPEKTLNERKLIISILNKYKIKTIDTYDYLHGDLKPNVSNNKIWFGHHTPFGNQVVCKAIVESGIYN